MITNFTTCYPLSYGRVTSFQPPWGMRTTAKFSWAFGGHPITSCTSEAIPAFGKSSARLITSDWVLTSVSHTTVNVVKTLVTVTWIGCFKKTNAENKTKTTITNFFCLHCLLLVLEKSLCADCNVNNRRSTLRQIRLELRVFT